MCVNDQIWYRLLMFLNPNSFYFLKWIEWRDISAKLWGWITYNLFSFKIKMKECVNNEKIIICFILYLLHFYHLQILFIIYNMLDILTFLNHRFDFSWERKRSPVNKSKVSMRMYDKLILISVHQNIVARTNITFNPVPTFVFSTFLSQEI